MTDQHRNEPSDEQLIAAWRDQPDSATGQRAFARLVERHHRYVYQMCWRNLRDTERALDITQEVFVNVYRGLHGFSGRSRFRSWLFMIVQNRCMSEGRRKRPVFEGPELLEPVADDRPGPDRELIERLDYHALLDLIRATLTPLEQDAIHLRCEEDRSDHEISTLLGIEPVGQVRVTLQRARRKLLRALQRRDDEPSREEGLR